MKRLYRLYRKWATEGIRDEELAYRVSTAAGELLSLNAKLYLFYALKYADSRDVDVKEIADYLQREWNGFLGCGQNYLFEYLEGAE